MRKFEEILYEARCDKTLAMKKGIKRENWKDKYTNMHKN